MFRKVRTPGPLAAICLLALSPLGAQNSTPPSPSAPGTGRAQIKGVVVDSLNGRYLSGADVLLQGGNRDAETDSTGTFHFDSLPPGNYQLGVFHPMLDVLAIAIASKPFHLGADSASFVVLAVPSASTIIHERCPDYTDPSSRSAVIGRVNDPETLEPVRNAEVSMAWTEIEISKQVGLRQTPHLLHTTTNASGAYTFCGLPNGLEATLVAKRGADSTAEIPISLGNRPVEVASRTLLLHAGDSAAKTGNATVTGVVQLEDGAQSAGSRVELIGTNVVALTDANGEFTMRNLPSGSRMLLARHLGFAPQTIAVDLSSRQPQRVAIKLPRYVAIMDPVLVTARRNSALDKVGFGQRSKSGAGYFMGPDRLRMMHPFHVTDVLRLVPGLLVINTPQGDIVTSRRDLRSCVDYYVDDIPYTSLEPGDINTFISGGEIVAVEVYQSGMAPPQYSRGGSSCTSIVLWTKFKTGS